MMKVFIGKNYSCDVIYQYYEIIAKLQGIEGCEFVQQPQDADVIIFASTCSSHEQRIYEILSYIDSVLKQKKPEAKTYLTGCLARDFLNPDSFSTITNWLDMHIDCVIPNNQTEELLKDLLKSQYQGNPSGSGFAFAPDQNSAYIYLSSGCLHKCSFCKTTFQKTPLVSMDISEVKNYIDMIDEEKIENLDFYGMNISQFGLDTHQEYLLPSVIDYTETKKNIKNVTLVGFAFSDAIHHDFKYSLKKSSKVKLICGSAESGENRILDLMDKGYTIEEFLYFCQFINQDFVKKLETHIIAGYPTETMEDVKTTMRVLREIKPFLEYVEINRYKDSPFVKSHSLEQLPKETIQEHARAYSKFLQHEGIPSCIN